MPPRLSIVVPVYNVELYLDECLESIAAQTFDDFEVVIVDDGSTDASAVIAKNFAERDQRFRVVLQKNAGLGAARNVGFRHLAEGTEYVAFVDSDDTMPPYAYEKLIAALDKTGSDFAGGNVRRFRSVGMQQSWGHRIAFANTRLKTHISKFPALVTDRTAWNKVYRRSFWEEHGFAYPEGILYEDAPVSIPAHYFAKSVDVIGDVVYHWRVRETGERSITQRATDPVSLTDRVTSVRLVREALLGKQGEKYARYLRDYDRNVLSEELPLIYKYVGEAGPEFRAAFVKEVGGLIREIGTEPWSDLTVADRLKAYLAREGRVEEFIALVQHQKDFTYSVPVKGLARPQADYPFLKAPVPAKLLTLGPRERRVVSRVEQVAWSDGKLLLRGYALPGHMGAESRLGSRKMLIFRENGKRRRTVVNTRTVASPMATVNSPHLALRHADWAGFSAVVDPTVFQSGGKWREGIWSTSIAVTGAGGLHRARLKGGEHDSGLTPPPYWATPDVRILPTVSGVLTVQVEIVRARVLDVRATGDDALELTGELAAEAGTDATLQATQAGTTLTFPLTTSAARPGGRIPFTVTVPLAVLGEVPDSGGQAGGWRPRPWNLSVVRADGTRHPLAHDERGGFTSLVAPIPGDPAERTVFAKRGMTGHLILSVQASPPLVDTVTAQEGVLTLGGTFRAPASTAGEPYELVLHNQYGMEFSYPVTRDGDRFEASFEPVLPEPYAGRTSLPQGRWWPTLRPAAQGGSTAGLLGVDRGAPVQLVAPVLTSGPHAITVLGRRMRVEARLHDRMALVCDPVLSPHDRSHYAQRVARDVTYPAQRALPVKDMVVYDTFKGNGAGDSPRAVHEELLRRGEKLEHVWLVRDGRAEVPPTARAVQYDSMEAWEVLARARYYVVNDSVPPTFSRRPGQTVVQTWHGTPLKQIGYDFTHDYYTSPEVLEGLQHDSAQWSLLASPSSYATPILRRALGYQGEVIEAGSPRTDALVRPDAARIAEVRRRLGLPDGKKVVLYLPTWRENRLGWTGGYKLDLRIDLDAARRELGEDHVLLVRGHHKVGEQVREGVRDGFVVDVSRWPDTTDLLLVADVLISDYSSALFDFALTDRPILLFTYDLEHYRDTLRGFTFDLESKAPGPLLADSPSLIAAVRDSDAVGAEYAGARAAFRAEFCDLDDGHAAARVVDRMLAM